MVAISQVFKVGPEVARGIVKLAYPFSRSINEELKKFPGVRPVYETEGRQGSKFLYWQGPIELRSEYARIAKAYRFEYVEDLPKLGTGEQPQIDGRCLAHQVEAILAILEYKSHLVSFETGGGKTLVAIEALRILKPERALVVCPANAKAVWARELEKWTPKMFQKFAFVQPGKPVEDKPYVVVNYELLHKVPVAPWEVIVVDELHYAAKGGEGGSKRAKLVNEMARLNPTSYRIGLTATPIMTDPKQFFFQADFLFPDRFGSYGHFIKRYSGKTANEYATSGFSYEGLDKDNAKELQTRISSIMSRATMEEFGEHLPGFTITKVTHQPTTKFDPEAVIKSVLEGKATVSDLVRSHTNLKLKLAVEEIMDGASKTSHVIALTHYKDSAAKLCEMLRAKGLDPVEVTGSIPVAKRARLIADEIARDKSIIVATMHSVKESIDLTAYTRIYLVELYWSPGIMVQALGRFHRLSSKKPAQAKILCVKGSAEENIAAILEHRFNDQADVYSQTPSETRMNSALTDTMSDDDFAAYLRDISSNLSVESLALLNSQEGDSE